MTPLQIQTLRTDRLCLEPLSFAHSGGMFALWSCEEVCRHSGPAVDADGLSITLPAVDASESDRIIDFFVRRAEAGLGFRWAMLAEPGGTFIGALGFNHLVKQLPYLHFLANRKRQHLRLPGGTGRRKGEDRAYGAKQKRGSGQIHYFKFLVWIGLKLL